MQSSIRNEISGGTQHQVVQVGHGGTVNINHIEPRPTPSALNTLPRAGVFVGREDELARLLADLRPAPGGRAEPVVSVLTGMAGVGKTALAVAAGHRAQAAGMFEGVLYLNLHGYAPVPGDRVTADQAVNACLRWLGVPDQELPPTEGERAARYRGILARWAEQGRRVLVVADNVSSIDQVTPLLPGAPGHRVLATSRDSFVGLPDAGRLDVEVLSDGTAVELLDALLRTPDTGDDRITAAADDAAALAGKCGGLPLALELAAGLLKCQPELSAGQLVQLLADEEYRLDELELGTGHPVRAAFDLSYRRLTAEQSRLFALLALAPGPQVSIEAAAALAGLPVRRAGQLVKLLRWAHLIQVGVPGDHYRFHDLVRLYAAEVAEQLPGSERDSATDRLLGHYLGTARAAASHLAVTEPDDPRFAGRSEALEWFETERPDLVAAVALAARTGRDAHARDLASALALFLDIGVHWRDLDLVVGLRLGATRRLADRIGEAHALRSVGTAHLNQRRLTEAISHYRQAAAIARELGDRECEAWSLNGLGIVLMTMRQHPEAVAQYRAALTIHTELGNRYGQAAARHNLGIALGDMRRSDTAFTYYEEALAIYRELGDRYGEGMVLTSWGCDLTAVELFDEALARHRQALDIRQEIGDHHGRAATLVNIGLTYFRLQRSADALGNYEQALALYRELGDRHAEALSLDNTAFAKTQAGAFEAAVPDHLAALAIHQELGDRHGEGSAHTGLGLAYTFLERFDEARGHLQQAVTIHRETADQAKEAPALTLLAGGYFASGRYDESIDHQRQALVLYQALGDRPREGECLGALGAVYSMVGRLEEAITAYRYALAIHREVGNDFGVNLALRTIASVAHVMGHLDEAAELYRQALPWLEQSGLTEDAAAVRAVLAELRPPETPDGTGPRP
ncbi:tetratricopeptide repeat protein [Kitasatospora sp. GP82]|uniref:tetratricopeptide repeat protein n=1 Tax=Kitasatospora sp. GP82 TaxID=3035089 RepID=UPI002475233D|nr:tetratricopeptide repeat protein [Kitasatospora sp. GP82]MDH6128919.1 tetratricopeptide (TPR) repeat protein [Kitasatospora sp. GP82]